MLQGKRLLVTGVLTDDSIAWHTAHRVRKRLSPFPIERIRGAFSYPSPLDGAVWLWSCPPMSCAST